MIPLHLPSPEWASAVFGWGAVGLAVGCLLFLLVTRKERRQ